MPASSFLQARECGVLAAIAYEDVVSLIVAEPAEDMETAPTSMPRPWCAMERTRCLRLHRHCACSAIASALPQQRAETAALRPAACVPKTLMERSMSPSVPR
jgi:hypothetical protein